MEQSYVTLTMQLGYNSHTTHVHLPLTNRVPHKSAIFSCATSCKSQKNFESFSNFRMALTKIIESKWENRELGDQGSMKICKKNRAWSKVSNF